MSASESHAQEGRGRQGSRNSKLLRDEVSGVGNRTLFVERLKHWLSGAPRRHRKAAVCLIDLDSFSLVNDAFGQSAGDAVLSEVGDRLRGAIRPGDTVARLYGDEFAILLEDLESEDDAVVAARRVHEALGKPFTIAGNSQKMEACIGIAPASDGASADELLSGADAALSRAKQLGRGQVEFHGERIRERALERLRIERELRAALERDELHSVYQPIVSLVAGRIVGFESLLRWDHPVEGTLAPDSFLEVAEQSGLIVPIGREVLARACEQAQRWNHPGSELMRIYVNVSGRQLSDGGFLDTLEEALTESGVVADGLCLEVTETALMDGDRGPEALAEAKALGFRVVLDDFGTGYSSLTHLSSCPMDEIKIDRSFVEQLDTRHNAAAIVSAIVSMARELGVDAVAEGVETERELEKLRAIGCKLGQGFRFARPMDPDAVPGVLYRESRGESLVPSAVMA